MGHSDSAGHTSYRIVTEINGSTHYFSGVAETYRRFSDFEKLHEDLRREMPTVMFRLPHYFPLSKAIFNGSAQLKEERRLGLHEYLNLVVTAAYSLSAPLPLLLAEFLGLRRVRHWRVRPGGLRPCCGDCSHIPVCCEACTPSLIRH